MLQFMHWLASDKWSDWSSGDTMGPAIPMLYKETEIAG